MTPAPSLAQLGVKDSEKAAGVCGDRVEGKVSPSVLRDVGELLSFGGLRSDSAAVGLGDPPMSESIVLGVLEVVVVVISCAH
jgi:hypothetical protein